MSFWVRRMEPKRRCGVFAVRNARESALCAVTEGAKERAFHSKRVDGENPNAARTGPTHNHRPTYRWPVLAPLEPCHPCLWMHACCERHAIENDADRCFPKPSSLFKFQSSCRPLASAGFWPHSYIVWDMRFKRKKQRRIPAALTIFWCSGYRYF